VTITGGKWTTYRRMAADAVDHAAEVAGLPVRPCATADLRLHGWAEAIDRDDFFAVYGSEAGALRDLVDGRPELAEPLHPNVPFLGARAVWAARHESARTVEDVLSRRTRALLLDARASLAAAPRVAAIIAAELGFDEPWQQAQVAAYERLTRAYRLDLGEVSIPR
jgi:glycerol-3-phosphate dehydrogenase